MSNSDKPLTPDEQIEILKDFKDWSGGLGPQDCDVKEIETYLEYAAPCKFDNAKVEELLEQVRLNPA